MKIVISSGHGKKIRGASGYIDEVDEARLVVEEVARVLRQQGIDTITFHDNVSDDQSENLNRIVDYHNSQTRDLDVSVHFNAYETTSKPMGAEVLYASSAGLGYAEKVVDDICIASGLLNRGPKKRTDLAFLNGTEEPAILIETCFVDSQADVDIYHAKFTEICSAIVAGLVGWPIEPVEPGPEPEPVPPSETAHQTLKKGMTGEDVAALQTILGIPADGDFGEITETQVEAFQAACDLDADGIVGPMTWGEVDALAKRIEEHGERLSDQLIRRIVDVAEESALNDYAWPDRGMSPPGYIPGMCLCYAVALMYYHDDDPAADAMAGALGNDDVDALAWLADEFKAAGMPLGKSGVNLLRHLFVLLIGLGMRESSGMYYEGRDMSASNTAPETAEAGLFQTSWNIASAHASIPPLLDRFWINPNGFLAPFCEGVRPGADNLDCYGTGDGATYQFLAKFCPLFATLVTAVGLRFRRQHWGPVNRKEVTLRKDADTLLRTIESMVEAEV